MTRRSDPAGSPNREAQEKKRWVEPVTALLMGLATLSTAWCSYQSAAWTRQSNRLMNEFNALERKAGLLSIQGIQQATIHTTMFMELLAAQQAGNEKLVNFYVERFPPEVHKAYDAWLAQKPFENPNADPHPYTSSPTPPSRPDFSASISAFVSMSAPRHNRSERAEVFAAQ